MRWLYGAGAARVAWRKPWPVSHLGGTKAFQPWFCFFFQLRPSPLFSAWNAENDMPQPYERLSTRDHKTFDLSISTKEAWPLRTAYSTRAWDA
jgi:hypothetical protein